MVENLLRWFGFRILLGLAPVAGNALRLFFADQQALLDLSHLVGRGELLLLICAICAGSIGELLSAPKNAAELRITAATVCIGVIIAASFGFALIAEKIGASIPFNSKLVAAYSVVVYATGLLASFACVVVAELGKKSAALLASKAASAAAISVTQQDVQLLRAIREALKGTAAKDPSSSKQS